MTARPKRKLLVGTCGFIGSQARTFRELEIVEVQVTFYQPPAPATAERWRRKAPEPFVFTLKAWQLVTHEAWSPTYRRLKEKLTAAALARTGGFRWNEVTRMAWQRTQEIAEILGAEAIVFQTPRSFTPTRESLGRMRRFFEGIDRKGRWVVFEPRGEAWRDDLMEKLIEDLDLIHGVDPFIRLPVGETRPRYFRLSGRPAYTYRYVYTDDDLRDLEGWLSPDRPNRVLFNNDAMAHDAGRFLERLGLKPVQEGLDSLLRESE
ncbi:MAG: DUF72 domain-containing protein [bacterium]